MKISSQLANNFDYCSAEIGVSRNQKFFTPRPPRLRGAISEFRFTGKPEDPLFFMDPAQLRGENGSAASIVRNGAGM